jgi:hypothetical protein
MFYNKRDIMHAESTISGQTYVFNIMKEETRTKSQGLLGKDSIRITKLARTT